MGFYKQLIYSFKTSKINNKKKNKSNQIFVAVSQMMAWWEKTVTQNRYTGLQN